MAERYRVGRRLGRTVYRTGGTQPVRHELVGMMDTAELAAAFVAAMNAALDRAEGDPGIGGHRTPKEDT